MNKKGKVVIAVFSVILLVGALAAVSVLAPPPKKACRDNIDNDGDGLTDWPADPGCSNKNDNNENNCGNGVADGTEICDGSDLNGATCVSEGFSGGTLGCVSTCDALDTSGCFTNSCSDSDGGFVVATSGTVSGTNGGFPFSFTDHCNNGTTVLTEHFCSGTSASADTVDCLAVNFTGCSNGACV